MNREAISIIYMNESLKRKVYAYVLRMGGNVNDAEDVFHDGIIAIERNIRQDKFQVSTTIDGYLYSICRFLWNNQWRKRSKTNSNELDPDSNIDDATPEVQLYTEEKKRILSRILDLLDDQCRKILVLWKSSFSMAEIANECGLSSEKIAKKYRYRCMKKLNEHLKNQKHLLEELRNV